MGSFDVMIQTHTQKHTDPGTCFLCPGCPNNRAGTADNDDMDCVGRPRAEGSAACVETTAYALLALREADDTQFIVCLAQWLIRIRGDSGGFYSSQVSCQLYDPKPAVMVNCLAHISYTDTYPLCNITGSDSVFTFSLASYSHWRSDYADCIHSYRILL